MMKGSTPGTIFGLLAGAAIGVLGLGRVNVSFSPLVGQVGQVARQYAWWIAVLSMLVPLADYLMGSRTTVIGVLAHHPFRSFAGFFAGIAVGLGLFLLLAPRLL